MARYIDVDILNDKINKICTNCGKMNKNNGVMCNCCYLDTAKDIIDDIPTEEIKQTDGDLISRQAVKDLIRGLTKWGVRSQDGKFENVGLLYDDVMFGIDRLPSAENTAELQPIVRGKWHINKYNVYVCSNCGKVSILKTPYCGYCCAKMEESE